VAQLFDLLRGHLPVIHTHLLWYSCIKPRALVTGLAIDGGGGDGHLLHDSSIIEFLDIE
jgi:hypothetical protein